MFYAVKERLQIQSYCDKVYSHSSISQMWILKNFWILFFFTNFIYPNRLFSTFKIQNSKVSFKVGTIRTIKQVLVSFSNLHA